ncbi:MAG: hypothetical protein IJM36_00105 [Acholeplasmatales bacterium]|nr:hypothetical protein [Acholeplasmatales bacterium]
MKNIKARYIWIAAGVLLLIAIGLIIAVQYTKDVLNTICLVSLIICFILITILIQFASFKSFSAKRNIKYEEKEYKLTTIDIEDDLKKKGYKMSNRSFGRSYLLIKDKKAYKVSFIDSSEAYFNNNLDDEYEPNKELDKCKLFTGIEIFNQIDEANFNKLKEFTIQTKNVYYTAVVKMENGNYKCLNYEAPNENHKESYEKLFKDICLEQINNGLES